MDYNWWLKVLATLFLFLLLVILGSNISAKRLAAITGVEISPPFYIEKKAENVIMIDILGSQYDYSLVPVKNRFLRVKDSIQKSFINVKCSLVPRFKYLNYLWTEGINKLEKDIKNIYR